MARGRKGTFEFDTLTPSLKRLLPAVDAAVDLVFDRYEPEAESYMRTNAPWTDRTGNARNGLFAQHDAEHMVRHELTLYGTMPYTFWLEVKYSGKYAIVGPSLLHLAPLMAGDLAAAVKRAVESV
jgi:hypothetical protein